MDSARDLRIKRLRLLASQRGMLEVELVLRPFARDALAGLGRGGLDGFERLLAMGDLDLWEVLCGKRPAPEGVPAGLLERLRTRPK